MTEQASTQYITQLQAIHALRSELGLTRSQYQLLLHRLTGSYSAKHMTERERERVISYMSVHRDLSDVTRKAQQALDKLNSSFDLASPEPMMDKELYLNGDFITRTQAPLESIITMMRYRYGSDVRLVAASEERDIDETSLKLEFVA